MPTLTKVYAWMVLPLFALGVESVVANEPYVEYRGLYGSLADMAGDIRQGYDSEQHVVMMDFGHTCNLAPAQLEAVKHINDSVHVLFVLSQYLDEATVIRALRLGVDGYLTLSSSPDTVLWAIHSVAAGQSFLEPQVTPVVLSELRKPLMAARESDTEVDLSTRERALLQLAADGLNNRQIAEVLGIRDKTVRNIWSTLFEKIHLNDRTQAVLWAIRTGYAELR
jgi:DNA-binding NarL/FixJ family response regulator